MWREKIGAVVAAAFLVALAPAVTSPASASSMTRSCGKIGGVPIHAHEISCKTALHVYRADMAGKLPAGWSCSASLARCYHGEVGRSSKYMWWRRTTYRLLTTADVVLGGTVYGADTAKAGALFVRKRSTTVAIQAG